MKVLILEDNDLDRALVLRAILATKLTSRESVTLVETVKEAVQYLSEEVYDVVISDLNVPDGSGPELIKRLSESQPDAPIVVVTNDSSEDAFLTSHQSGVEDFFTKGDITTQGMRRCVANAVERKRLKNRLRKALKAAESASTAKTMFCSHMSHEIRTPLNLIIGAADLLIETELSPEQNKLVKTFQNASEHLLGLISDVLEMSKIEAGELTLANKDFSLQLLVDDVRRIVQASCRAKGLQFEVSVDPSVMGTVNGDAMRLKQILMNLLGNGIKFTESGRLSLDVKALGGGVQFVITDSGIGIPEDKIDSIFGAFQQIEGRENIPGTGLGLAIVKEIVEQMSGTINIDQTYVNGARFLVWLPLEVTELPASSGVSPISSEIEGENSAPSLKILTVDDSMENLQLMKAYFANTSHDIQIADSGQACIDLFKKSDFDLILLDIRMPSMDGHETLKQLRAWEVEHEKSPCPIYALSANALREDIDHALSVGFTGYLTKPIRKATVMDLVSEFPMEHHPLVSDAKMVSS